MPTRLPRCCVNSTTWPPPKWRSSKWTVRDYSQSNLSVRSVFVCCVHGEFRAVGPDYRNTSHTDCPLLVFMRSRRLLYVEKGLSFHSCLPSACLWRSCRSCWESPLLGRAAIRLIWMVFVGTERYTHTHTHTRGVGVGECHISHGHGIWPSTALEACNYVGLSSCM